jgi:hypothetical protein
MKYRKAVARTCPPNGEVSLKADCNTALVEKVSRSRHNPAESAEKIVA